MMTRSARLLATVPLFFAALMLPLSFTGGVMTTPAIGHALGGSPLALMWLTNGFMLPFGGCLLGAGVAADKLGSRRLFFSGLLLFVVSCGLIGIAQSTWVVGGLRTLQGLAAALTLAAAATALAQLYEGAARTRAFSLLGTLFGLGLAFGPLLIGVLTQHGSWRWVYVVLALMAGLSLLVGPCVFWLLPARL
jgi:Sugar phosphate permease